MELHAHEVGMPLLEPEPISVLDFPAVAVGKGFKAENPSLARDDTVEGGEDGTPSVEEKSVHLAILHEHDAMQPLGYENPFLA